MDQDAQMHPFFFDSSFVSFHFRGKNITNDVSIARL
jgi:hypothetical protein